MSTEISVYKEQLLDEISELPEEYLPNLLKIIRLFCESVTLKPAEASLRQGLEEALSGETRSVSDLWNGIDGE